MTLIFSAPAVGYRGIEGDAIFGANIFADYERTSLGENFWVLSPGLEWMSVHWDAHLNGYLPTKHAQQSGSEDYASNYGDDSSVTFVPNTNDQGLYAPPPVSIGIGGSSGTSGTTTCTGLGCPS